MKYNHLNVPTHWKNYWSRYPEGHTILESLISWVSQVDSMVDNVNTWNAYLDNFVATFDTELQQSVTDTLSDWKQTGFLDVVINDALHTKYHEMNSRLTAQMADTVNQFDAAVGAITVDSEVVLARGSETTLKNRLDTADAQMKAITSKSKNLFDKTKVIMGQSVRYHTGDIGNEVGYAVSEAIEILPSTEYYKNIWGQFAFYDENMVYISGLANAVYTFTTPVNAKYVRLSLNLAASIDNLDTAMLVQGGKITYRTAKPKITSDAIAPNGIDKSKIGFNLPHNNLKHGMSFVVGDIYEGSYVPSTTRIRTNILKAENDYIVSCDWHLYDIFIWTFDDLEGLNSEGHEWQGKDFIIDKGTHFALAMLTKTSPPTITDPYGDMFESIYIKDTTIFDRGTYVKSIAHRGYSQIAPENTIPAIVLAKKAGFEYVEIDIKLTSDDKIVAIHDFTIDRTSNGTGTVNQMTLAQLKAFDYGAWKHSRFTGTSIPTIEEVILCCKEIGIGVYIELADAFTDAHIERIVNLVRNSGMSDKVVYIGGIPRLQQVLMFDTQASLGSIHVTVPSESDKLSIIALKNDNNDVFIQGDYSIATTGNIDFINWCYNNGIGLEAWTVNTSQIYGWIRNYVRGITTDQLILKDMLIDNYY